MKIIDFKPEDVFFIKEPDLKKYFTELNELIVEFGTSVETLRTFKAKSLTPYEEKTNYEPIVQIGKEKFVPLSSLQGMI